MSIVSGSSAVRGLRGVMSWEFFVAPDAAPVPFAVRLPRAGYGSLAFAPMRIPGRGTTLLVGGTGVGASALALFSRSVALLSRSVGRLAVRASPEMPVRAPGTIEALLVEGIAATTLGGRGVSSDGPGFLVTSFRSAAAPLRISRGVIREVIGD
ncbi:MAG TPA: hypothetical protein VGG11_00725 [Xanthobacteraceae bacterium]